MKEKIRIFVTKMRLRLAHWIAPAGFDVFRVVPLAAAQESIKLLDQYAQQSGHLRRAYHAGKRVRFSCKTMLNLLQAGTISW